MSSIVSLYHCVQAVPVETHGKGKQYTRVEGVPSLLTIGEFRDKFGLHFTNFCRHIVPSWFLTNTKGEMMLPLERRSQSIFIVSDFAENVTVVRKKEVADQYFHRPEILLFGAVSSVVLPPEPEQGAAVSQADLKLHSSSHLVSSDFRLLEQEILFVSYDQ